MIVSLVLPAIFQESIAAEARTAFPRECCGLLEGIREDDVARVVAIHRTRNLAEEDDRFEIDPATLFGLLRRLRGSGREVIGCYHSHPNGRAEPSVRDLASAQEKDFVWLIAAVAPGGETTLAAFAGRAEGFAPLRLACAVAAELPERGSAAREPGQCWLGHA